MTFLQWLTTPQFAELYTNSLPGFFSLSNHFFEATNPAAREMMEWRDQCDSTIRVATQILSRGTPKLGDELAEVSQQVLLGTVAPKAAADRLEQGLKGWYAPHQGNQGKGQECQCEASVPAVPVSGAIGTEPAAPVVPDGQAPSGASATQPPSVPVSGAVAPAPPAEVEEALASELEGAQP